SMSGGRFNVSGTVYGPYRAKSDSTVYRQRQTVDGYQEMPNVADLVREVLAAADKEVNFGLFDCDGDQDDAPNSGDDDGIVDTVFIVHNQFSGQSQDGYITSQYASLSSTKDGPYVTCDDHVGPDKQPRGKIKIDDYVIISGISAKSSFSNKKIAEIG